MNFRNRTCYYFDDIMKVQAINVDNILLDENNLVYKHFMQRIYRFKFILYLVP